MYFCIFTVSQTGRLLLCVAAGCCVGQMVCLNYQMHWRNFDCAFAKFTKFYSQDLKTKDICQTGLRNVLGKTGLLRSWNNVTIKKDVPINNFKSRYQENGKGRIQCKCKVLSIFLDWNKAYSFCVAGKLGKHDLKDEPAFTSEQAKICNSDCDSFVAKKGSNTQLDPMLGLTKCPVVPEMLLSDIKTELYAENRKSTRGSSAGISYYQLPPSKLKHHTQILTKDEHTQLKGEKLHMIPCCSLIVPVIYACRHELTALATLTCCLGLGTLVCTPNRHKAI